MDRILTLWKSAEAKWLHRLAAASGRSHETAQQGWIISRVVVHPPPEITREEIEFRNDLEILGFGGLLDVEPDYRINVGGIKEPNEAEGRTRWNAIRRAAGIRRKISARDLLRFLFSDFRIPTEGATSRTDLSVYWFARRHTEDSLASGECDWETESGITKSAFIMEWSAMEWVVGSPTLSVTVRYLREHPDETMHIVYGWEPSVLEVSHAGSGGGFRCFVGLQTATWIAELLLLAKRIAPEVLFGIGVGERERNPADASFSLHLSGASKQGRS